MSNDVTTAILTALNLNVAFGEQIILDSASLSIHEGDRIGLVGRNGAGKSTFLKIISDLMPPDSGDVATMNGLVVGFLSQEFTLDEKKNVYENIKDGAKKLLEMVNEYENLPYDSPQRDILEKKIEEADAWNIDKKIAILMKALSTPDKERSIINLSGGEKRRTALCRALISQPDLLILDEPTNHLDTDSIEWIENYLSNYEGTCIFVTHDRYFLDRIATRIVELSQGKFISHQGNYTDFLVNKSEREAIKEAEENKRQNFLRRELEWVRRGPKARTTKAKSRLDNFYEVESIEKAEVELDVDLVIPPAERLGNKVLELKNISVELGGKLLIENLFYNFQSGRKIGIVGKNGIGKTTLLRVMMGDLAPTNGQIDIGENTQFNYVDQSRLILDDEDTVFRAVSDGNDYVVFGKHQMSTWTYLRRFLFTDDRINTLVGRLSGGERSRLTLAKILKSGGNFIMLDEPTNDLDLATLRVLEEAIIGFGGCVVVVSHDRYFLNRVCNTIMAFEGDGKVYLSEGNYDYFIEKRKVRRKDDKLEEVKEKKGDTRVKEKKKKLTWNEQKELESIEEVIMEAEGEVDRIEAIFADPEFYDKYAEQTKENTAQLETAKAKVKALYTRWEELEAKRDSAV